MKAGDKIYIIELNKRQGVNNEPIETEITKVGKKYFETSHSWYGRFHKDSLLHDAGVYSSRFKAYLSIKDYEDQKELAELYSKIRNCFSSYVGHSFTLDQLRMISKIIEAHK